jgi:hypothetical protein
MLLLALGKCERDRVLARDDLLNARVFAAENPEGLENSKEQRLLLPHREKGQMLNTASEDADIIPSVE